MRRLALVLGISIAAVAGGAYAQRSPQYPGPASVSGPQINVALGPALQARAADFGARDVEDLRSDLRNEVSHAFAHARYAPARIDLVIEDATPNRPTFAQLGRTVGLSMRSVGIGGARISGMLVGPDGVTRPIRYQFYGSDLWDERGATTWSDADRSFMMLADELASGHVPDRFVGPGPQPHGGHFGYPYTGE
jgi:hypothetical protein